jgi:ATP-dependent RNA circularization protein (DNA/RNA ligase family)
VSKTYPYPKTPQLPWSETICSIDYVVQPSIFSGREVVVTEKMDGENTTMYKDLTHGKLVDSPYHPSRSWVHGLHSNIRFKLNDNQRICGENVFWVKSIIYTSLPSYFLVYSIWEDDTCFSWEATTNICNALGLETAPVLYRGQYDEELIKSLYDDTKCDTMEGYVIRATDSFNIDSVKENVAQFSRREKEQEGNWLRTGGELNMLRIKKR